MSRGVDLAVDLGGFSLKNPVLTASGTFGFGLEFKNYGDLEKLGGIVVKGLSLKPRQGNPPPRIAETPCGMLNAIGIQNPGVESFVQEILPQLPWRKTRIIANLYACSVEEFGELASVLAGVEGIAALEVNVSCPNVQEGGVAFGQDPTMVERVTESVSKNAGDKPVLIKLSPNVTDVAACAKAAENGGASGISLINTLLGMAVDLDTRRPLLANVVGGFSGPAIKPVALRCVYQAVNAVSIPVVGVGGIVDARDALEFIMVGAHAVQIGTANFTRPDASFRIVDHMEEMLVEMGVKAIDELRGKLVLPGIGG